ncbi:CRISPR-associated endonuclease Cas3'' [Spirulina sp. CS-785/01]|uniref:CRISPR-associated endonuclease Cas3'' n=1 Tax=Spirulina sp. CS-785/01 TaxID=3021716 RepID=UPI00232FB2ED|nr:CRISPR-associated endonuclease Cas3'' [Spirulina sp. CS-785/01]MDB9314991.1 CRISPR-associated endonuclease Cas3'' [Spirulina sp. CS-785/01]
MEYWARIAEDGRKQPLQDHLQGVARLTSDCLPDFLQGVGFYAGLWHDLGKYRRVWQDYLQGKGAKQVHAAHGAKLALELARQQGDDPDIPALAYTIAGHHTGLPNRDLRRTLQQYWKGWEKARDTAQQEINEFLPQSIPDIELPPLKREFAIRMLFSALVDSDRTDAANFEKGETPPTSLSLPPSPFDPYTLKEVTSELDQLRNRFAADCITHAPQPKGFYRLTGVCGIGKTQSSLRWGLIHGKTHQMRGIVYVAPLKVIIEETAQVYRDLLGENNVLEHHSGYEPHPQDVRNYKLDTERWDKSYIVTSGVQFYESLFANRPGQCRKLHQLRDRVILIDEAQSIPPRLALPILDVLATLVEDWGCSVVLYEIRYRKTLKNQETLFGWALPTLQ